MLVLTFAPCAGVVFLPSTGANTPLALCCGVSCIFIAVVVVAMLWWQLHGGNQATKGGPQVHVVGLSAHWGDRETTKDQDQ